MKRSEQSGLKALAIIIFVIMVAFSIFRCYYFFTHKGEEFVPSLVKRILWPEEETQEVADAELPMRLTVNPEYDGKNEEYIYSDLADTEAVVRICQSVEYEYYNDSGSAIKTVNTKSFDAKGKVLSSGYRRESCQMADTSILWQSIEIDYRYDVDEICRDYKIISYARAGIYQHVVDSTFETSVQDRT